MGELWTALLQAVHMLGWPWLAIAIGELVFWIVYWRIDKGPPRNL
ncbi:hypothetical protein [Aestuariivirga sp.]|jgi:hypothetical protein